MFSRAGELMKILYMWAMILFQQKHVLDLSGTLGFWHISNIGLKIKLKTCLKSWKRISLFPSYVQLSFLVLIWHFFGWVLLAQVFPSLFGRLLIAVITMFAKVWNNVWKGLVQSTLAYVVLRCFFWSFLFSYETSHKMTKKS